jgi:hypothetical protein
MIFKKLRITVMHWARVKSVKLINSKVYKRNFYGHKGTIKLDRIGHLAVMCALSLETNTFAVS